MTASRETTPNEIKISLIAKLAPSRLKVSGLFHAILGCMLDQQWTDRVIVNLCIDSSGGFLAQPEGHIGFNEFIGSARDFFDNLRGVASTLDLTDEETQWLIHKAESYRVRPYVSI